MSSESPATTVEVRSGDFQKSILLQVTAYSWTQKNGNRVLTEARDLQLFPSVFKLEPGAIRNIFLRGGKSLDAPRYYRLKIEELQPQTGDTQSTRLAFLRAFDLPVFVESPEHKPELTTRAVMKDDGEIQVDISNQGQSFFAATKFSLVSLQDPSAVLAEHSQLNYILPGNERSVYINLNREVYSREVLARELTPAADLNEHTVDIKTISVSSEGLAVRVADIKGKHAFSIPVQRVR